MSKNSKGGQASKEKEITEEIVNIENHVEAEKAEVIEEVILQEEDVIIYSDEVKAQEIKFSIEHKPVGDINEIGDTDIVLVQRGNYVGTCTKAWATDRSYEIIGRV